MAAPAMSHASSISRLRQRAGFLRVKAEGRRVAKPAFTLQVLALPEGAALPKGAPTGLAMGFTCSKAAISKRAVDRNRARRRLQAAVRLALQGMAPPNQPTPQPVLWLVWVAKLPILTIPFAALQVDVTMALMQALTQAGLMPPQPPAA
jgi:ribonuclease P protein component